MSAASQIVAPVAAEASVCPNAQFRTGASASLPDCRAYELVSPSFKYGQPIETSYSAISASGDAIMFDSIGGFDGAEDDNLPGNPFLAHRGAGGWVSESLDLSGEQFRRGPLESISPLDFNGALSEALVGGAPNSGPVVDFRLYRRGGNGQLQLVGPLFPPAQTAAWTEADMEAGNVPALNYESYLGASQDLSRVFFDDRLAQGSVDWEWPGDETVYGSSLYEYIGEGHTGAPGDEPALVGVDNAGRQISQCGTVFGASDGLAGTQDAYNAISKDGRVVYFTAKNAGCEHEGAIGTGPAVSELYARIDNGEAGAHTVDIGEPSKVDCAACETFEAEPSQRSPAVFQGAASDGSIVFFLSEQALLPGASGKNLYEFDFDAPAGERVSLVAPDADGVMRVAENGSGVYFVASSVLAGNLDAKEEAAVAGAPNMYRYDTTSHDTTFVATLSEEDGFEAVWSEVDSRPVEATPDGQFILFPSYNGLTPGTAAGTRQLYRYDAAERTLVRVTIGENGMSEDGVAGNFVAKGGEFAHQDRATARGVAMASEGVQEGKRVFFSGAAALTKGAPNRQCASTGASGNCRAYAASVYEWEQGGDGSCPSTQAAGCVYLISDGEDLHGVSGKSAVTLEGASPSGNDVFFDTADALVPQDTDTQVDLYDARVGGGFPVPVTTEACHGEGCEASSPPPPNVSQPLSELFSGAGNPIAPSVTPRSKAPVKCVKGKKSRKVKCSKRRGARSSGRSGKTRAHHVTKGGAAR